MYARVRAREGQVLHRCANSFQTGPNKLLEAQHGNTLDTGRIEAAMFKATGYRLKVEQKVIQVNLSDAFDAHPDTTKNQIETGRKANAGAGFSPSTAS